MKLIQNYIECMFLDLTLPLKDPWMDKDNGEEDQMWKESWGGQGRAMGEKWGQLYLISNKNIFKIIILNANCN